MPKVGSAAPASFSGFTGSTAVAGKAAHFPVLSQKLPTGQGILPAQSSPFLASAAHFPQLAVRWHACDWHWESFMQVCPMVRVPAGAQIGDRHCLAASHGRVANCLAHSCAKVTVQFAPGANRLSGHSKVSLKQLPDERPHSAAR
jgi:hypothetical protein